jgi:hypothetical protein
MLRLTKGRHMLSKVPDSWRSSVQFANAQAMRRAVLSLMVGVLGCGQAGVTVDGGSGAARTEAGPAGDSTMLDTPKQDDSARGEGGTSGTDGVDTGAARDAATVETSERKDLAGATDGAVVTDSALPDRWGSDSAVPDLGSRDSSTPDFGNIDNIVIDAGLLPCGLANTCANGGCCVRGVCIEEGDLCPVTSTWDATGRQINGICKNFVCGSCGGAGMVPCGQTILDSIGVCTAPNTVAWSGSCFHCGDIGGLCCGDNTCTDLNSACSSNGLCASSNRKG